MKQSNFIAAAAVVIALAQIVPVYPAIGKSYDIGTEELNEFRQAEIVSNPQPEIPAHLQEEGYNSSCIARFTIGANGKARVSLLTSSGSDEIDDITLSSLRHWKFKPAMLDGKPVVSTRRVKVEFEVK